MYNDKLVYNVVIWVSFGIILWKEKEVLNIWLAIHFCLLSQAGSSTSESSGICPWPYKLKRMQIHININNIPTLHRKVFLVMNINMNGMTLTNHWNSEGQKLYMSIINELSKCRLVILDIICCQMLVALFEDGNYICFKPILREWTIV